MDPWNNHHEQNTCKSQEDNRNNQYDGHSPHKHQRSRCHQVFKLLLLVTILFTVALVGCVLYLLARGAWNYNVMKHSSDSGKFQLFLTCFAYCLFLCFSCLFDYLFASSDQKHTIVKS